MVKGPAGPQVFTLQTPDQPYRLLIERMNEGAASISAGGLIVFCNERLAEMVGRLPEKLVGSPLSALAVRAEQSSPGVTRPDLPTYRPTVVTND